MPVLVRFTAGQFNYIGSQGSAFPSTFSNIKIQPAIHRPFFLFVSRVYSYRFSSPFESRRINTTRRLLFSFIVRSWLLQLFTYQRPEAYVVRNAVRLIRDYNNTGIKTENKRVNVEGNGIRLNVDGNNEAP